MPKLKRKALSTLLGSKHVLSIQFDKHNGDFDTLVELIRAYVNHDLRALEVYDLKNMEELRDVLEIIDPKFREIMIEETSTPERLKEYLADLENRLTPNPIP